MTVPKDSTLSFNESTRELIWKPDRVSGGSGFSSPPLEVAFQVGLTPSLSQADSSSELISVAQMTARDVFTGVKFLPLKAGIIKSDVPDDPTPR